MRQLLVIFLVQLMLSFKLNAQTISGFIKEGAIPVHGATVSLQRANDSSVIKLSVTKEDGAYLFPHVAPGTYFITTSFVGYIPAQTPVFTVYNADIVIPDLKINKAQNSLQAIVVTAKKRVLEVKADKIILNVEGAINAIGNTALELLRKAPSVMMDKDDNLQMNGKEGVKVYIDGRPSPLAGKDLSDYLRSLPSSQIEAIELIANPSAKFDAAGSAGIINIRLKKNKNFGTNASVDVGYGVGIYGKYNGGMSVNYRNRNINVFSNYSYNNALDHTLLGTYRTIADTVFDQQGTFIMKDQSHTFKTGVDFSINKKSAIGATINGNLASYTLKSDSWTPIIYQPAHLVDRVLKSGSAGKLNRNDMGLNVNYNLDNGNGTSLSINGDYNAFRIHDNLLQPNYYLDNRRGDTLSSKVYSMASLSAIDIAAIKADYEQPLKGGTLSLGSKIAYITSDNDLQQYNVFETEKELDKERSNHFLYKEQINAGYISYKKSYKYWAVQGGLRMENTMTTGTSTGLKKEGTTYLPYAIIFKRAYTNLFPSAAISFTKNPQSVINLSYSHRIDRPDYQSLNPFGIGVDEYMSQRGNPNLRPQYSHSLGVTHTYKNKLISSLSYSTVKGKIISIIDTAERSKAFIAKVNLASEKVLNLNVSYPYQYKSYNLTASMNAAYKHIGASLGAGRNIDLRALGVHLNVQNSISFAENWTAELTGFFKSPYIDGSNLRSVAMWSVDAGIQRKVLRGKGIMKAAVSDLFNSLQIQSSSYFAGQQMVFNKKWETRQFKVSFVYRFGNSNVKGARQSKTSTEEETQRVQ